jgi:hypothetical protein
MKVEESEAVTFDFNVPNGHRFVANSTISHNTFLLAVFATYCAIFKPGSKILLISAGFRQSKLIFNEIERIYNNSPLLKQLAKDRPHVGIGECYFEVCNGSTIKALPLGQGDKIRGQRANITLVDEFDSIPRDIFDVVVRGFSATALDPYEKTKTALLRKKGKLDINLGDDQGNKIILSGTAGFRNGTFYHMFKDSGMAHSITCSNNIHR